jgi:hypothetical protein
MRRPSDERGQVLVLFAFMLTALLLVAAVLFDGAHAVLQRRMLQNAADAAAMAGANRLQGPVGTGCAGSDAVSVATAAATTLAGSDADVNVSCPASDNDAIRVTITGTSPSFFGGLAGMAGIPVDASSTARYGGIPGAKFSVVQLNPYHATWPSGRQGCPSVLVSGTPTVHFGGSLHVNSACPASAGGAMSVQGSASLTMSAGTRISIVGGYTGNALSPAPLIGQRPLADPLRNLPLPPVNSLPVISTSRLTVSGTQVLSPGVYTGGIAISGSSTALLKPGIYVLNGGGLTIAAQAAIFSVANGITTSSPSTWATDCPASTCGVLIYSRNAAASSDAINVSGQASILLRAYLPEADLNATTRMIELRKMLIWQDASPVPTASAGQPDVTLAGGGTLSLSGTIYAPSAKVVMQGGSGGSGGGDEGLAVQFISWDATFQGNSNLTFLYGSNSFASPVQYGLVE